MNRITRWWLVALTLSGCVSPPAKETLVVGMPEQEVMGILERAGAGESPYSFADGAQDYSFPADRIFIRLGFGNHKLSHIGVLTPRQYEEGEDPQSVLSLDITIP